MPAPSVPFSSGIGADAVADKLQPIDGFVVSTILGGIELRDKMRDADLNLIHLE